MQYEVITDVPGHLEMQDEVTHKVWPEFMMHDPVSNSNWLTLFELFPECQFTLKSDGKIIGLGNSIPFHWDKPFEELPEEGWDWVLEQGIRDRKNGIEANIVSGLQIVVNERYQGKALSSIVLQEMKQIAKQKGYRYITLPVRPNFKSKYPLISIDNYIHWERQDGLPFDPWLRVHARNGGKIIKACHRAMYIHGKISEWETWTTMRFPESGEYIIPGV